MTNIIFDNNGAAHSFESDVKQYVPPTAEEVLAVINRVCDLLNLQDLGQFTPSMLQEYHLLVSSRTMLDLVQSGDPRHLRVEHNIGLGEIKVYTGQGHLFDTFKFAHAQGSE